MRQQHPRRVREVAASVDREPWDRLQSTEIRLLPLWLLRVAGSSSLQVPRLGDQHEVLPPTEDLVDGGELSREADRLPYLRRFLGDLEAIDARGPRVCLEQRGQDPAYRGLASTVGAEQGEDTAPCHLEVHPAQHVQLLVGLLVDPSPRWLHPCSRLLTLLGVLDRLAQAGPFLVHPVLVV